MLEMLSLAAFFIGYKFGGIMTATACIVAATITTTTISYIKEKTINKMQLVSVAILLVFSGLTLFSGNTIFIKMKPTIIFSTFAITLLFGQMFNKPLIKYVFGGGIQLEQQNWQVLNFRFAILFAVLALTNEVIWRNFDENIWVNFKVFGTMGVMFIFIISQLPFLMKHKI